MKIYTHIIGNRVPDLVLMIQEKNQSLCNYLGIEYTVVRCEYDSRFLNAGLQAEFLKRKLLLDQNNDDCMVIDFDLLLIDKLFIDGKINAMRNGFYTGIWDSGLPDGFLLYKKGNCLNFDFLSGYPVDKNWYNLLSEDKLVWMPFPRFAYHHFSLRFGLIDVKSIDQMNELKYIEKLRNCLLRNSEFLYLLR
jgi:hypothetical protein